MATRTSFFNGVEYNADDVNMRFAYMFSDGIITGEDDITDEFEVTAKTGLTVNVNNGVYHIKGAILEIYDDGEDLTLSAADASYPRIDTIVAEYNLNADVNAARVAVVAGTPTSTPAAAALSQTAMLYQQPLAYVRVEAGATSVATITDARGLACSVRTQPNDIAAHIENTNIHVSTSDRAQWNAAFREIEFVTNCNTIDKNGIYYVPSNSTGAPDTAGYVLAHMEITGSDDVTRKAQIAWINGVSAKFWLRTWATSQNAWQSWHKIVTSDMFVYANGVLTITM